MPYCLFCLLKMIFYMMLPLIFLHLLGLVSQEKYYSTFLSNPMVCDSKYCLFCGQYPPFSVRFLWMKKQEERPPRLYDWEFHHRMWNLGFTRVLTMCYITNLAWLQWLLYSLLNYCPHASLKIMRQTVTPPF